MEGENKVLRDALLLKTAISQNTEIRMRMLQELFVILKRIQQYNLKNSNSSWSCSLPDIVGKKYDCREAPQTLNNYSTYQSLPAKRCG